MRWGPLPVSTLPAAVLTVIAPRPLATGDALLRIWHLRPAAPNTRPCVFLASGTQAPSSSQSPLYSGRPSVGIRHAAPLRLLSPPNPLRWALAGPPMKPVVLLTSGALAPTKRKFKVCALYGHRLLWQNRGSWPVYDRRPAGRNPRSKAKLCRKFFAKLSFKKAWTTFLERKVV